MKPIIGVIMRDYKTENDNEIKYVYKDICEAIIKSGGIPIGINGKYFFKYFDICKGYILQGGDDFSEEDLILIKNIINKDMPLLGICLGMQEIGYMNNGTMHDIDNHKDSSLHEIIIKKNSLLNKILGCEKTLVNSRHKSALKSTDLLISAVSNDNVIEAIEDENKKFLLGVQWHPENMYSKDLNSRKIFDYFVKVCNDIDK